MSDLEKLIEKFCPLGVEYKKIEDISIRICSGGTPKSGNNFYYNGEIFWLRTQELNFNNITQTELKITNEGLKNSSAKLIPKNCVIVAMYGATVGKVGINKVPLATNQACCNIEVDSRQVLYKYIFYYFCNRYKYIKSLGRGSQNNINIKIIRNLEVPVPPIEVQNEIVRILDNFTELTEELNLNLEKELEARKKQYEYYRDLLLTFGSEVERVELNKICKLERGSIITKNSIVEGKFPVVAGGKKPAYYCNKFNREGNIITVSSSGANAGYVSYWIEPIFVSDAFSINGIDDIILTKYIYYYLKSIQNKIYLMKKGGGVPHVKISDIKNFKIPLPPLHEQQRIVDILDRFDALCNDITKGLPAEIEARKKQYEYYRDLLLNFKSL